MKKLQFTNAENIKLALMMKYRFSMGAYLVSTEVGNYSSDVLVVTKDNTLIEFETKVSLVDFKADFRKDKHNIFENASKQEKWDKKMVFVPHYFYFAVPESIVTDVLPLLVGKPYGVVAVPDIAFIPNLKWVDANKYLRVVKRAVCMRKFDVTESEKKIIISRMSSELINLRINKIRKEDHGKKERIEESFVE